MPSVLRRLIVAVTCLALLGAGATLAVATNDGGSTGNAAETQYGQVQGCTPGFWKNHTEDWVGYTPNQTLGSVFAAIGDGTPFSSSALANDTLIEALNYGGGGGNRGAAKILLRSAVAALLNASLPGSTYPLTTAQIIAAVNAAINEPATLSTLRADMLALAAELDGYNNTFTGCHDI